MPNIISPSLVDIVLIYNKVKALIILAENIDIEKRLPLNTVNELRNALDHLIRFLGKQENVDGFDSINLELNLQQTIEHIYRAGYDACDVIAINLYQQIDDLLEPYNSHIIVTVIPNYYVEIKPKLEKLNKEIRNAKNIKGKLFSVKYFDNYDNIIVDVLDIKIFLEEKIQSFNEIKIEHDKKDKFITSKNIIIALVTSLFVSSIFYFLR
jgi:hypothetical protein